MNKAELTKLILEVLKESEAEAHIPDEPEEESEFKEQEFGLDIKDHGLKEYGGISLNMLPEDKKSVDTPT